MAEPIDRRSELAAASGDDRLGRLPGPGADQGVRQITADAGRWLIIFDCDGVLVDSEPIACAGVAEALAARGLAISAQDVAHRYIGMSAASMYRDIEASFGHAISEEDRRTIDLAVDRRLATSVKAMPGAAAALQALVARCAMCVGSSGTPARIAGSLTHAGLKHFFDGHIFSAAQVARGKPAPDLFLYAAAAMGIAPSQCLVVEDSVPGVSAARAAGMPCLGFVGGSHIQPGHALRLLDAGAMDLVEAMAELPHRVERIVVSTAA